MELDLQIKSDDPMFVKINRILACISVDLKRAQAKRFIFENITTGIDLSSVLKHAFHMFEIEIPANMDFNQELDESLGDSIGKRLHDIYCGMEAIMESVSIEIDSWQPAKNSYKDLLKLMDIAKIDRPAIIDMNCDIKGLPDFRQSFKEILDEIPCTGELVKNLNVVEQSILPEFLRGLEGLRKFMEDPIKPSKSEGSPSPGD